MAAAKWPDRRPVAPRAIYASASTADTHDTTDTEKKENQSRGIGAMRIVRESLEGGKKRRRRERNGCDGISALLIDRAPMAASEPPVNQSGGDLHVIGSQRRDTAGSAGGRRVGLLFLIRRQRRHRRR
jgi:hypothetical protein